MIEINSISDLEDLKITVMGLGINGGGFAAANFLASANAKVCVTDLKSEEALADVVSKLKSKNYKHPITFHLGRHREEDFTNAHIVIKNPAVLWGNKYLQLAPHIETDLSLFLRFIKNPIIAVTGSKGKSTTASSLYHILSKLLPVCYLGGNITISPLSFIAEAQKNPTAPIILELSSWQLSDIHYVEEQSKIKLLKPQISIITNILHDHQNTYNNFSDYVKDKQMIYKNQTSQNYFLTYKDDWGSSFSMETNANHFLFSVSDNKDSIKIESPLVCEAIKLSAFPKNILGLHNQLNLGFAIKAATLFGCKEKSVLRALKNFKGIKHRMELVKKFKMGKTVVKAINDSAATMPDALIASCKSYNSDIYLLAGGTDKELDFSPLKNIPTSVKKIFLFEGSATQKFLPLLNEDKVANQFTTMQEAVAAALAQIKKDRPKEAILLLSPGAASFGLFINEFDRGNQFIKAVMELA